MASNIYKFFDFLEKKAGKTLPPDTKAAMKLGHAKELLSDKEVGALPLGKRILYFPERLTKEDLVIDGSFHIPDGVTQIPEGIVVKGTIFVPSSINKITTNVQAESVHWEASSNYYPKSFNGATFKNFVTSMNRDFKNLPENVKVTDKIDVSKTSLQELPEGLKTGNIDISNTEVKILPSKLECNELNILNTAITEIPAGVVVHKKLTVTEIPEKFPSHIEDVISIGGYITIKQEKAYETLPEISIKIGKKVRKGKGIQVSINDLDKERLADFIKTYFEYKSSKDQSREINRHIQGAGKVFNAKFDTVYFFIEKQPWGFKINYFIHGKDNKNRELLLSPEAIISAEGQASTKSFGWGWNPTERQLKDAQDKLFPQTGEKPTKAVGIRTLMNGPQSKRVFWAIGRKQRGGTGVQGKAKDLIPSLSGASQDNMERYAEQAGVTWGDMMVFDNNGAINIIAKSNEKEQDGNFTYFDKFGYGQGGGSRIFTGPDYTVV